MSFYLNIPPLQMPSNTKKFYLIFHVIKKTSVNYVCVKRTRGSRLGVLSSQLKLLFLWWSPCIFPSAEQNPLSFQVHPGCNEPFMRAPTGGCRSVTAATAGSGGRVPGWQSRCFPDASRPKRNGRPASSIADVHGHCQDRGVGRTGRTSSQTPAPFGRWIAYGARPGASLHDFAVITKIYYEQSDKF